MEFKNLSKNSNSLYPWEAPGSSPCLRYCIHNLSILTGMHGKVSCKYGHVGAHSSVGKSNKQATNNVREVSRYLQQVDLWEDRIPRRYPGGSGI